MRASLGFYGVFFLWMLTVPRGGTASHFEDPVTTAKEQRGLVELLAGSSRIQQRYSDGEEILEAVGFLRERYSEIGLNAQVVEYSPDLVFPAYREGVAQTYRSYLAHRAPEMKREFHQFCNKELDPPAEAIVRSRLERVGLDVNTFCLISSDEMRFEHYVEQAIEHSVQATRDLLAKRRFQNWPNVVVRVESYRSSESGPMPLCVVGAHLDSVVREGGNRGPILSPLVAAPGADDNASGTAAVFALARAAAKWDRTKMKCDFAFVHFSGEEEGLFGSLAFVQAHVGTGLESEALQQPISWMINLDMIGYRPQAEPAVTTKQESATPLNIFNIGYEKRRSRQLADQIAAAGNTSTVPLNLFPVVVESDQFLYSSDQITFWDAGIPAISISEQACSTSACMDPFKNFNPYLHTTNDIASRLDYEYSAAIINWIYLGLRRLALAADFL